MNPKIDFATIPRLEEVARHIVKDCLRIEPGELVRITGGIHQYWLLSRIKVEVNKVGGHPILQIVDDYSSVAMVNETPKEYIGVLHDQQKELGRAVDVNFYLKPVYDPRSIRDMDREKIRISQSRRDPEKDRKPTARTLVMEWPTPPKAEIYGMTFSELEELFWKAFWVDLEELTQKAQKLKVRLQGTRDLVLTSGESCRLEMAIGDRPLWIDTGCFTPQLLEVGDRTKNLPCGEVYCSPEEDSVSGDIYFEKVFYQGDWIRDLVLTFEKGTIREISAGEGEEIFRAVLDQHSGDKDRVAELGIGLNPHVPRTMGNTLLDEKVVGSIHLAIGRNTMYGGINKSTLHWDLVCMSPTITVEGKSLMKEGELQL